MEVGKREVLREDVPLVEFMYLVFSRMPGESYRRATQVFVVMFMCDVFRALSKSLAC